MPESAKSFSLLNCLLNVAGVPLDQIGGFSESDMIEVEPASDHVSTIEGCDGSVAFADTNSSLYNVKIRLLQTSSANAALMTIYVVQRSAKLAVPMFFKDTTGADIFSSAACMIVKPPKFNRGNKITSQEWALSCADGVLFLGGN